jgi:hypothetical protein
MYRTCLSRFQKCAAMIWIGEAKAASWAKSAVWPPMDGAGGGPMRALTKDSLVNLQVQQENGGALVSCQPTG